MSRTTIDFGIDLGTTNSAIAVLKGVSTEIIKNNDDQDVTPSAVSFGKNGPVRRHAREEHHHRQTRRCLCGVQATDGNGVYLFV